jgi:hypothetical protein
MSVLLSSSYNVFEFGDFSHKDESKKRFLVYRIGMALRPFRPKDTANIMKKKNTPNNFRKINGYYGFCKT